ncbi:MAG: RNB domain-containing ribonuclease [Elusimicrobia bacterium]|nr:RNB domain-containing ribonuclease [Elusimicrobiota bacterium]
MPQIALLARLLTAFALAVEPVRVVVPVEGVAAPIGGQAGAAAVLPGVGPGLAPVTPAALALPARAIAPVTAAALGRPLSPKAAAAAAELAGAAAAESEAAGQQQAFDLAAPEARLGALDVLEAERPALLAGRIHRIREVEKALVEAVGEAAKAALGAAGEAVSRGSTSRLTNDQEEPDYDLMVAVERLPEDVTPFMRALQEAGSRAADRVFAGATVVSVARPRSIIDPASRRVSQGIILMPLEIRDTATGRLLVDADVSLTDRPKYANAYPRRFAAQLDAVRAAGGPAAAERMLSDIRLAKRFFREAVGVYKTFHGGPGGVGVEQLVLAAGSFDKMVERLHAAAVDEGGRPRTVKDARAQWFVRNEFMQPENFLNLLSDKAWKQAGLAARAYLDARAEGKPVRLAELAERKDALARAQAGPGPVASRHASSPTAPRQLAVRVSLPRSNRTRTQLMRLSDRLARRLGAIRRTVGPVGGRAEEWLIRLDLRPNVNANAQANLAERFFSHEASFVRVLEISRPADGPPVALEDAEGLGRETLGLLDRFTNSGPRPAERGDAFLYAQGAKAIPAGLEESWKRRSAGDAKRVSGETYRAILNRKDGRPSVRIPLPGEDGRERLTSVRVPDHLAQGVVNGALVEVALAKKRIAGVRPIGSYPMDMMIGRIVDRGDGLVLEGLFSDRGRSSSLYAPLPIVSGRQARRGMIVQAFVRPAGKGFEAVPLLDLGGRVTPEIAARDIALRHGARGYFERAVIEQAERTFRTHDAAAEFAELKAGAEAKGRKTFDLRGKPFITIDPKGAGDLDDAYAIERHPDGGWTWYLATADVAHFVKPGSPGFRAAARIGNTFYSIDKDGVPEFPMNHPVVSKSAASLLAGKESLAMITVMRFGPDGRFLLEESDVGIGIVKVEGRYDYDQVARLWNDQGDGGIAHLDQIALARELSRALTRQDDDRGKLDFNLPELRHRKVEGVWGTEEAVDPPLTRESHRLIEELKVYGNRVIATRLQRAGAPHISRVHEEQQESVNLRLREELAEIGVPWESGTVAEYLASLRERADLHPRQLEVAQVLVRNTRKAARYASEDTEGHEGLALEAGAYDHPSAPIRRFSDMYNRALLESYLAGGDPRQVHADVLRDLRELGFRDFDEYLEHLNGRAAAARYMDYEVDDFMSVYELAKPENRGKTFTGYVTFRRKGMDARVEISLEGSPATVVYRGKDAEDMRLLEEVRVEVRGANLDSRAVDFRVIRKRN